MLPGARKGESELCLQVSLWASPLSFRDEETSEQKPAEAVIRGQILDVFWRETQRHLLMVRMRCVESVESRVAPSFGREELEESSLHLLYVG